MYSNTVAKSNKQTSNTSVTMETYTEEIITRTAPITQVFLGENNYTTGAPTFPSTATHDTITVLPSGTNTTSRPIITPADYVNVATNESPTEIKIFPRLLLDIYQMICNISLHPYLLDPITNGCNKTSNYALSNG